jgi:hypothetical protein
VAKITIGKKPTKFYRVPKSVGSWTMYNGHLNGKARSFVSLPR